jgi:hypothetical protein
MCRSEKGGSVVTSERQYPLIHRTCSPEHLGRSTPQRKGPLGASSFESSVYDE